MGISRGFLEIDFVEPRHLEVSERIRNFNEFTSTLDNQEAMAQAGRCMDCGIPFCTYRCPLRNNMPDFNQCVSDGDLAEGYRVLERTSCFPEITGRICPAPCEEGCTLGLHHRAVGIRSIERKLADYAFAHGLIRPWSSPQRSGHSVAIIGSGPAGMACAQNLARMGHAVTVFEKNERPGGLLRYGIPDFKLQKELLDRRLTQLRQEGVNFVTGCLVGEAAQLEQGIWNDATTSIAPAALLSEHDAVVICCGCETPRDLPRTGRELGGIHFALDFLIAQNVENYDGRANPIEVRGREVVVIGGGETASDCVGTAIRKGAAGVTQIDYHERLPETVEIHAVWPGPRRVFYSTTSHEEGCTRLFAQNTLEFRGQGQVEAVTLQEVRWGKGREFHPVSDATTAIPCDVALIAMGYAHPGQGLVRAFGAATDARGNVAAALTGPRAFRTSVARLFAAGDGRLGQSLVVNAIAEGRDCALAVDRFLMDPAAEWGEIAPAP